ncbi:hypothetical protein IFM89_010816 [Coptis chinensis]|uniref:Uncharacterized protein n=1 Tax=Coptis chinensis TaxID=261450 RepID=A0A835IP78_9MAGN|nr:hypothetical protein IFM89_010816 [Coptis chinensis]
MHREETVNRKRSITTDVDFQNINNNSTNFNLSDFDLIDSIPLRKSTRDIGTQLYLNYLVVVPGKTLEGKSSIFYSFVFPCWEEGGGYAGFVFCLLLGRRSCICHLFVLFVGIIVYPTRMVPLQPSRPGNCSSFKEDLIPHSCQRNPVIADLIPEAPGDSQSENCCHDGLLSAWAIEPSKSFTSFEIKVGNLNNNSSGFMPQNLTIMAPGSGYTCSPLADFKPTIYPVIGGRREQQAFIRLLLHAPIALADAKLRATVFLHALGTVFSFRSVLAYNSNGNISLISSCAVFFCQDFSLLQADPTNLENRMMCTDHMFPI